MRFIKSIVDSSNWCLSIVTILIGISIIFLAFINSPLQLQVALGLIGVGIVSVGLVQIKQTQNSKKMDKMLTELRAIQQELGKQKEPETSRTAIADVITAGLKYYADRIAKQTKEGE